MFFSARWALSAKSPDIVESAKVSVHLKSQVILVPLRYAGLLQPHRRFCDLSSSKPTFVLASSTRSYHAFEGPLPDRCSGEPRHHRPHHMSCPLSPDEVPALSAMLAQPGTQRQAGRRSHPEPRCNDTTTSASRSTSELGTSRCPAAIQEARVCATLPVAHLLVSLGGSYCFLNLGRIALPSCSVIW